MIFNRLDKEVKRLAYMKQKGKITEREWWEIVDGIMSKYGTEATAIVMRKYKLW